MPQGYFIITDISGYTAFLTHSELEHAHDILQSLFTAQLNYINLPLVISGFQGDAILMYTPETNSIQPQSMLETLENLYISFSSTLEQMQYNTTCPCRACRGIAGLDLKMVVHYGSYMLQKMADREELLGADVIIPHRMLKNHVIEQTGIISYALFSESAAQALQLRAYSDQLKEHTESYEHLGELQMLVYDLRTVWERELARRRKMVPIEQAWVKFETTVAAPPALVWDYLTIPSLKVKMTGLDFMQRTDSTGGRVGPESTYHCAHGGVEFYYKIVDWKPFDYFTILQTDSITNLETYETYYFFPVDEGTRFISCLEKPDGEVPPEMQGMVQELYNQAYGRIKGFIEEDIANGKAHHSQTKMG